MASLQTHIQELIGDASIKQGCSVPGKTQKNIGMQVGIDSKVYECQIQSNVFT